MQYTGLEIRMSNRIREWLILRKKLIQSGIVMDRKRVGLWARKVMHLPRGVGGRDKGNSLRKGARCSGTCIPRGG
jgi:hypothetical protein